uniref:hypothetical protein n=1 Tax=Eubacterium cellulosolvens TaxID=29322 RepID=UPI0004802FF3|nr:hypothetical protein [[Eubacterium] cellulosolvens]
MQLTITLIDEKSGFDRDIIVNADQKIGETMAILGNAGYLKITERGQNGYRIRSGRSGKYVDPAKSYAEENIFYGDILNII